MITDGFSLSSYLILPTFWEALPSKAETLLFFQTDSIICAQSSMTLNDFLGLDKYDGGYDWLGAVWEWQPKTFYGGNGGLSLRRKSVMINITRSMTWDGEMPEVSHNSCPY